MVGLRHRRAEAPLQLRLQRQQLLALALQAAVVGEVQLNLDETDEAQLLELALDLLRLVDLDHIALLHVGVVLEDDAALEARLDLADVVLEAAKRSDPAVVDDGAIPPEPRLGAAADGAVGHVRAG